MEQNGSGLAAVSSLDDPVRRSLYEFVSGSAEPVGRDEAAAAAGIGRPLAAYHLDKLVGLGLLSAADQRPAGRGGPGAGRPAKVYARSGSEFAVSVPPREYELAARLLAVAVESDQGGTSAAALHDAARQCGVGLGERSRAAGGGGEGARQAAEDALRGHGYEPSQREDGTIRLRNCPFHQLAAEHRDLVCGMNLALIEGLVTGLGASGLHPALDPQPGCCCVVIGSGAPAGEAHRGELS
ncbi:MAG: helix-turn-helix transcriptional regulator [Streptosporangiaceae bacterium]